MKATIVIHGLCAGCGAELPGGQLRFFIPVSEITNDALKKSRRVCVDCFVNYLQSIGQDQVRVVDGDVEHGEVWDP